ncbi:MAG: inositol monophosphatase family protein [Planctomycetota bacterium]|nr:inositol monophosphatase family protein [Planctomycetota bacterium]
MHDYIRVCEDAARKGGAVLLDWQGRINPREKAPKDLVSEADLASQQVIYEIIHDAFPDHDFLGEEGDPVEHERRESEFRWIVDPLDGTVNYVHRLPAFSVSVALEHRGQPQAGVVYDPIADECFSAVRGEGAFLNGVKISVSSCESLRTALVAASFSAGVSRESEEISRFIDVLVECQTLRRLGSAALNLAYLAAGRIDAYWATSVKVWDVAAGLLLVQEGGGHTSGIEGEPFVLARPQFAAAATSALHEELVATLNRGSVSPPSATGLP